MRQCNGELIVILCVYINIKFFIEGDNKIAMIKLIR